MANRDNLAYDLSIFEEKKLRVVPKKKKAPEPKRKYAVAPAKVFKVVVVGAVLVGITAMMIFSKVQLAELTAQTQTVTKQLTELKNEESQLLMKDKVSMQEIDEYAKTTLGMDTPQSSQIVFLNSETQDRVVRPEKSKNFLLKAIDDIAYKIKAYLS